MEKFSKLLFLTLLHIVHDGQNRYVKNFIMKEAHNYEKNANFLNIVAFTLKSSIFFLNFVGLK